MKTNDGRALTVVAMVASVGVVLASGYLYYLKPQRPWPLLVSIAVMGIAWIVRGMLRGDSEAARRSRHAVTQSIILAGLLLGAALTSQMGWTSDETRSRILGVLSALVVVMFANVIPKHATCPRALSMLRAVGWALVLGGLGYALAWIFLPLAYANGAAMAALLAALAFAIARFAWFALKRSSTPPGAR